MASFSEGTLVTVTATFASTTGVPTDPTTVTVEWAVAQTAAPTTWIYGGVGSISRTSTGIYVAELDTTSLPGLWVGEWIGTGACQVTQPFQFLVDRLPL